MKTHITTHPYSPFTLSTRCAGILGFVAAFGLAACDDDRGGLEFEESASDDGTPDGAPPYPEPDPDEPESEPSADEEDESTPDESGDDDDSDGACEEAPAIATLEVDGFEDLLAGGPDNAAVGSIRFTTEEGESGEIRVTGGIVPRVEYLYGEDLFLAVEVDLEETGGPSIAGGACATGFPQEAISYVVGGEQVVAGAIASGVFDLYDDALGQAMGMSPELTEMFVDDNGGGQPAEYSCEQWCELGSAAAGAGLGAALGGAAGNVPGAIAGAVIGAVAGKSLMWDCIEFYC